jgi:hypothetical protein
MVAGFVTITTLFDQKEIANDARPRHAPGRAASEQ